MRAIGADLESRVRVVVVRGAGPSFCAGIDLRMFTAEGVPGEEPPPSAADPGFESSIAGFQAGYLWLRNPGIVSIAAVQGHAIGAGFQLALSCDLRILADDAKLCMKEPALGLVPDLTGTKPLVDIVGLPRAIELCLTARTLSAARGRGLWAWPSWSFRRPSWTARWRTWSRRCWRPTPPPRGPPRRCCARPPGNTLEQQAAAERGRAGRAAARAAARRV